MDEMFWEVHSGLPQEGPGSDAATTKALRMIPDLPDQPRILDMGCGPGRQTMVLARHTAGQIIALDNHQPFLDDLNRRAQAGNMQGRITTTNGSMTAMEFAPESFDLVWSEGAIFIMGFELGLRVFWPLLKPGGTVVVSELAWFTDQPSAEAREFWGEGYPGMSTVPSNLDTIRNIGYELTGHFPLPDSAWLDGYYGPVEKRVAELRRKHEGHPDKLAYLDTEEREIEMFRKYSAEYGYVFFVMRKPLA